MFPKYYYIKEQQYDCQQNLSDQADHIKIWLQSVSNAKFNLQPTEHYQQEPFDNFQQNMRAKHVVRDYDISFQASFLEQHEQAFKNQTKNFIESSLKQSAKTDRLEEQIYLFQDNDKIQGLSDNNTGQQINQKANQFVKQFQNQQKIKMFMDFLCQNLPKQVFYQFLYLSSIAWEKFTKVRNPLITKQELKLCAENLALQKYENLFQDQRIKFLSLKRFSPNKLKCLDDLKNNFLQYVQFFFITFMLIAEQYFENPFNKSEKTKRQRDFSQENSLYNQQFSHSNELARKLPQKMPSQENS